MEAQASARSARSGRRLKLFDRKLLGPALLESFYKLDPRVQARNPVMFVVFIGSLLTTWLWIEALRGNGEAPTWFIGWVAVWLWFTVLFANLADALAEGRSKAQADALRGMRHKTWAKRLKEPHKGSGFWTQPAEDLRRGNVVLVEAGDLVPCDGEVIEGVASVDESAITGESAPVIRESGGDFSAVTGGTRVLSDWIVVRCTVDPGETFLDRMIAMVESAQRRKTPNEIALTILLVALTLVFLFATVTLLPFSIYAVEVTKSGAAISVTALIALLVCLIPTTIGALLSAIGVAGMSRMMQANVIATSGARWKPPATSIAAARQDGDDHARQSAGIAVRTGARRIPPRSCRCGATRLARRRDARGSQHRRAGEERVRIPRAAACRAGRNVCAVLRALANERSQHRRTPHPQGCRRRDSRPRRDSGRQALARDRKAGRRRRAPRQHAARGC